MPELPEVESARRVIEKLALGRRIVDVDDSDSYVCRPHLPGEIRTALIGRRLTAVHRRGKSMWCHTSGVGRSRTPGPVLGIHLGMSGKVVVADGRGTRGGRRRLLAPRAGQPETTGSPGSGSASPIPACSCWSTRAGWAGSGWTRRSSRSARTPPRSAEPSSAR